MFAYEVIGATTEDGEIYCFDCASPRELELSPIFAGDAIGALTCNECDEPLMED